MELDGDIGVAEQLGAEAEQCLSLLARRMQLHEMKLDALSAREEAARLEVAQLTRSIKLRKDMEATYTREAAAAREELSEKSYLFQELTRRASERLSTRALQLETARLEARTRDLQAKERALQRELGAPVDEAAVQALLQEVQGLHRRFEKVSSEHERARALALSSVQEASDVRAVRVRRQREEAEYHRLLEEAVEDMTLLLVEDELSAGVMDDGAAGDGVAAAAAILEKGASSESQWSSQAASPRLASRLAQLRDECDLQFCGLQDVLRARHEGCRALALQLGLLEELEEEGAGVTAPDSTTSRKPAGQPEPGAASSAAPPGSSGPSAEASEAHPTTTAAVGVVLSSDEQKQNKSVNSVAEIVLG
ncbi:ciliary rootlet coiled-coil protein 2-like isoform X2 [Frankliniella occidentalis]|uniref:Ciliary rootlet coiled-coil protein 2-like isoform X2 n=1 Tax=Frankliniella occidentalis TaxID=133901 RepID=A0A9C6U1T2_FRAOC|nr:ciliary rootlet coiled-coil protein 2-like isoform X2 [Frankliniella occidentalis]